MAPVPIASLPPVPPAQAEPPKLPRPEPEIYRVETPSPLKMEPVGQGFAAIAESLAIMAGQTSPSASTETPAEAAPAAGATCPIPEPKPTAAASAASDLAGDAIYWALTAAAGVAGVGVPSVGIWAAWKVARALIGKIASKNTPVSSLEASFHDTNISATSAGSAESLRWYTDQLDAQAAEAASLRKRIADLQAKLTAAQSAGSTSGDAVTLRAELDAARSSLAELQRKLAERPVTYLQPASDDGLARMRRAMKDVSESYAAARPWVRMFEDAYQLILSGEKRYGQ